MDHPEHIGDYLMQYRRVAQFVDKPYDSFLGEQVLNHLLDRDSMEEDRAVLDELVAADREVADALARAETAWWDNLRRWASQCGFAQSLWWVSIQYSAHRGTDNPFSLADALGGLADAWVRALGERVTAAESTVRTDTIATSFHQALIVGVAQRFGVAKQRGKPGPTLPKVLASFAQARPSVVLPGSVMVGFQLPRQTPGEPASGPADESVAALDVVMQASERYSPDLDAGSIGDIIDDDLNREQMWASLKGIYNAAGPDAETVEIASAVPSMARQARWRVHGKAVTRPRDAREITEFLGNVRAIDLDRHSLRVRGVGAPWSTAIKAEPSLFLRIDELAGLVIGQDVVVTGTTRDDVDPPRTLTASEIRSSSDRPQ